MGLGQGRGRATGPGQREWRPERASPLTCRVTLGRFQPRKTPPPQALSPRRAAGSLKDSRTQSGVGRTARGEGRGKFALTVTVTITATVTASTPTFSAARGRRLGRPARSRGPQASPRPLRGGGAGLPADTVCYSHKTSKTNGIVHLARWTRVNTPGFWTLNPQDELLCALGPSPYSGTEALISNVRFRAASATAAAQRAACASCSPERCQAARVTLKAHPSGTT